MKTPDPAPAQSRRLLPSRLYGQVALGFLIALLVVVFVLWRTPPKPDVRPRIERHQLHMIGQVILLYAAENEGLLPEHISRLQDPEHEYIPADSDMDWFISPFHPNAEMSQETVDAEPPTEWYIYGHYHFFPAAGLNLNEVETPTEFVLAYGSMQGDPPQRAAVFLDGTVRWISLAELRELKARQQGHIARE